jgi:cyanophycinase-like exopeptidase
MFARTSPKSALARTIRNRKKRITILHTRDRIVADSEEFTKPFRKATGVFLGTGNAGRVAQAYLGTRNTKGTAEHH